MADKITAAQLLRVFQRITESGERTDQGYHLGGVTAWSSIDGYTVSLSDGRVTVHVFFHQKFAVESPSRKATAVFRQRLDRLEAE